MPGIVDATQYEKPGVYENLSEDTYNRINALRNTELGWYLKSPFYYDWMKRNSPDATRAMSLGTALHCQVLQADLFAELFALEPDIKVFGLKQDGEMAKSPRATAKYKEEYTRIEGEGKAILTREDMDLCELMKENLWDNQRCHSDVMSATHEEVTLVWERDGILCKARLDIAGVDEQGPYISDVKTTMDIYGYMPWEFQRYRTHRQAAWYSDGARRSGLFPELGVKIRFSILAVGNNEACEAKHINVGEATLTLGRAEADWCFNEHRLCVESDSWGGPMQPSELGEVKDDFYNREIERFDAA